MDDMIIVGASGGIGVVLANAFRKEYNLYLTHNDNPLYTFQSTQVDLSGPDIFGYVDSIANVLSDKVIVVNCAGVTRSAMGHVMGIPSFEMLLNINLVGAFRVCSAVLPIMRKKGWGRIINLSSVVGHLGVPGTSAYSASKAGLEGMTRTLAVENASKGITVNSIVLGYMEAGMITSVPMGYLESVVKLIPMKRLGGVVNIVEAVRFLVAADYVTGTSITVDGGLLCA